MYLVFIYIRKNGQNDIQNIKWHAQESAQFRYCLPGNQIAIAITRFNKYVLSVKTDFWFVLMREMTLNPVLFLSHDCAFFSNGIISVKLRF